MVAGDDDDVPLPFCQFPQTRRTDRMFESRNDFRLRVRRRRDAVHGGFVHSEQIGVRHVENRYATAIWNIDFHIAFILLLLRSNFHAKR